MFSMPPARMTSDSPSAISWAAETMACSPEAHILLRVMAGEVSGTPEFMPTWRAGFMPWPAIRMLPTITCFISSTSMPDREITSLATVVPRSTAGISLIAPPKVPMAVLSGVEITISVPLPLAKLMFLLMFRFHLALVYQNAYTYKRATAPISASRATLTSAAPAPGSALGSAPRSIGARPIELERAVEELHVGFHPLLGEVLEELLLLGGGLQK